MQPPPSHPRLLLVGNFLSRSGVSPGVGEELAAFLRSRNWNLITTSTRANRPARLLDMLYTVWRRRNDYDLASIEVYSGAAFIWAEAIVWMLRQLRKPYTLTLHGGNLPIFSRRWPRRVAQLLAHAQTVTTPSGYLQAELNILRNDMRLIPNLLDIKSYPFTLRNSAAPRLVWLRAFHQLYNPLLAIDTLSRLVKEFPDIELAMVGPDKGDGSLQQVSQAVRRAGLTSRVRLVGGVPKREVPHLLAQRDIFLNTSSVDNTPVSVIEAMASGLVHRQHRRRRDALSTTGRRDCATRPTQRP